MNILFSHLKLQCFEDFLYFKPHFWYNLCPAFFQHSILQFPPSIIDFTVGGLDFIFSTYNIFTGNDWLVTQTDHFPLVNHGLAVIVKQPQEMQWFVIEVSADWCLPLKTYSQPCEWASMYNGRALKYAWSFLLWRMMSAVKMSIKTISPLSPVFVAAV